VAHAIAMPAVCSYCATIGSTAWWDRFLFARVFLLWGFTGDGLTYTDGVLPDLARDFRFGNHDRVTHFLWALSEGFGLAVVFVGSVY
jgi:hypothetical protein